MSDAASGFGLPFAEAITYFRQKVSLPSLTWRDLEGRAHDRSFVVAGAMKEALLADLRGEIDKAVAGEITLADFRKSFDQIVARHGWTGWAGEGTAQGRAWRTRVIFETNLRTAYAAGRYAQMTDKTIAKVYKWWRYVHGFYRSPEQARAQHKAWSGTVLAWDDPWWNSHYPPNGWGCSCGVETLSDSDLKIENLTPGKAPATAYRTVLDPKTGDKVKVPEGIDFGWDHAPGKDWSQGLVPPELQQPLQPSGTSTALPDLPPLKDVAQPFAAKRLPEGTSPEDAVKDFLAAFGADWEKPVLFRDKAGHATIISKDLFLRGDGRFKGGSRGRHLEMPMLAETLRDPDEIWVDWVWHRDQSIWFMARRYLRAAPDGAGFGSFTWSQQGWSGATAFNPLKGTSEKPGFDYLEAHRKGALLYRRGEEK